VLRTLLTTIGIVLGVALFVAMQTANQGVLAAFSETIDRVAGKTDLQITAGENGFGEEALEQVQSSGVVSVAVPVIEAVVDTDRHGTLLILGVDMTGDRSLRAYDTEGPEDSAIDDPLIFLAQADSLLVSKKFADRSGLHVDSRLSLGTAEGDKDFVVRGVMRSSHLADAYGGNLAVMDIYAAQKMFGRGRTFDRIDLALKPTIGLEEGRRQLTALLGPGFEVQPPATRGRQAESMLAGYTALVNISSAFALFIGMFIVYSAFATAVTQRRSEIGILRSLGATTSQIRSLFLGESLIMGAIGSVVGAIAGTAIATAILNGISALVGGVFGVMQEAHTAAIQPQMFVLAMAVGTITSVVSALLPARAAARVDPVWALRKGSGQLISEGEHRLRTMAAFAVGAISIICMAASRWTPILYVGCALWTVAALVGSPSVAVTLTKLMRPLLRWLWPIEGALAADSLIQAPRRMSINVAALMLSIALVVAFAGMATSTYHTMVDWVDNSLNADLFIMPSARLDLRTTRFPPEMAEEVARLPGVSRVQRFRSGRVAFRGKSVMLVAIEMDSVAATNRRAPIAGDPREIYRLAAAGKGILVSDSLAQLYRLGVGQTLEIPAPHGTIRLPIVGVILDYSDQQGAILIDRSVFVKYWQDDSVSDFRVFATPGAKIVEVRQAIVDHFAGRRRVFVLTNEEGRRYILKLTDDLFGMMNIQLAVAILVAVLGIFNSLTVSITDRRREFGVLQAVGANRTQIRETIWIEAVVVGVLGLLLGYAFGAVNLYYMLAIVQRDVAGLRLDYVLPIRTLVMLVPIMIIAALAAALWPAESAVRGSLAEALEYE